MKISIVHVSHNGGESQTSFLHVGYEYGAFQNTCELLLGQILGIQEEGEVGRLMHSSPCYVVYHKFKTVVTFL